MSLRGGGVSGRASMPLGTRPAMRGKASCDASHRPARGGSAAKATVEVHPATLQHGAVHPTHHHGVRGGRRLVDAVMVVRRCRGRRFCKRDLGLDGGSSGQQQAKHRENCRHPAQSAPPTGSHMIPTALIPN